MRNPYNSSRPGNLFSGYEKLWQRIVQGLANGRSYALMGGRRCGKTSLLRQLEAELTQHRSAEITLLPRYLDIQGGIPRSTAEFFATLSRLMLVDTSASPWEAESHSSQPYQDFLRHVREVSPQIEARHGPNWCVVFLIDELAIAATRLTSDDAFHNLRNLLMNSPCARRVRVVVSGVSGLSELIKHGSPLNNLEKQSLSRLDENSAAWLIAQGFTTATMAPQIQRRLLELTGRHPWLLQAILEFLFEEGGTVDEPALAAAVRQFTRMRDDVFQSWLRSLGEAGQLAYDIVARSSFPGARAAQIRARLPASTTFDATLEALEYHGIVAEMESDRFQVTSTIFRDWFLQNAALLRTSPSSGCKASLEGSEEQASADPARNVFVVYGRDRQFHTQVCQFLGALGLVPLQWNNIVEATGKGTPTIFEIIEKGFAMAGAAVVLLTGDDEARLRPHFQAQHDPSYEKDLTPQPRPNVIFEAGLAMAKFRDKTIFVRAGHVRQFSDIAGMHLLDLSNEMAARDHFAKRLENCGLKVDRSDPYWHRAGDLSPTRS